MKVLILAGGYGTRLYPIVKDIPKALLEVAGKTLIDHTLDKFIGTPGIDEVLVVTNAKFHGQLVKWADSRNGKPFPIRVINDGTQTPEERLGAMGDVLFVLDRVGCDCDWIIVGSDNLYDQGVADFVKFARSAGSSVTIGAYDVGDLAAATKYGVIELERPSGRIISLQEKPKEPRSTLISMCLYFYPRASLPLIQQFVDETGNKDTTGGYIQWLFQKTSVYGFKFTGKWYDIGSIESYNDAQKQFLA